MSTGNGSTDLRRLVSTRTFTLFIRTFAPYFDVLSTCIELKPAWAGHLWGIVRLVFEVWIKATLNASLELTLEADEH